MSAVLSSHCTLAYTPVLGQFKHHFRDIHTEISVKGLKGIVVDIIFVGMY